MMDVANTAQHPRRQSSSYNTLFAGTEDDLQRKYFSIVTD
jgi:hypothetical protein